MTVYEAFKLFGNDWDQISVLSSSTIDGIVFADNKLIYRGDIDGLPVDIAKCNVAGTTIDSGHLTLILGEL